MKKIVIIVTLLSFSTTFTAESRKEQLRALINTPNLSTLASIPNFFESAEHRKQAEKLAIILGTIKFAALHPQKKVHIILVGYNTIISAVADSPQQLRYTVRHLDLKEEKDEAAALVMYGDMHFLSQISTPLKKFLDLPAESSLTIETLTAALLALCS